MQRWTAPAVGALVERLCQASAASAPLSVEEIANELLLQGLPMVGRPVCVCLCYLSGLDGKWMEMAKTCAVFYVSCYVLICFVHACNGLFSNVIASK